MEAGLDREAVRKLGLDPRVVAEHQAKILAQLQTGEGVTFRILESGTVGNGVVRRLDAADAEALQRSAHEGLQRGELCTFVPAAGAASRYLKVYDALQAARSTGAQQAIRAALDELRSVGDLSDLTFEVQPPDVSDDAELLRYAAEVWSRYGALPKGLMPATREGLSYFDLKLLEHQALNPAGWLAVVVAEGMPERFEQALALAPVPEALKGRVAFLVQGRPLSTLRFDARAEPVRGADGQYSPVVAGHGELIRLFPEVARLGPHRSIYGINVDNVIGTSERVRREHARLYGFHRRVLTLLDGLREACRTCSLPAPLADQTRQLCAEVGLQLPARHDLELLEAVQRELFHTPLPEPAAAAEQRWALMQRLYGRPLTIQGLVPNSGEDVGGIPVYVDLDGRRVLICLEMPHAVPADQATYFRDPRRATHFNPVFVIHELRPEVPAADRTDPRFWMLTKKPHAGREVYYHETVLYEAVGNSLTNNVIFVEIPRFLFNPHKVYTDCRGRTAASYGFDL
jgi:hypothetical protein